MTSATIIVFDDITTLLQAQRDAAWGEVARRLAHEIKNPLTPIQLSARAHAPPVSLSTMSPPDAEIMERSHAHHRPAGQSMQQMVNAFSEYARAPRDEHHPLQPEPAGRRSGRSVPIASDASGWNSSSTNSIVSLEADRGRVRQILNNLITNALEALDGLPNPRLEVSTKFEQGTDAAYAVVTVCDNGPGFNRELLARVFDPYVTSEAKGIGLGLAIVKKIVEEHGDASMPTIVPRRRAGARRAADEGQHPVGFEHT